MSIPMTGDESIYVRWGKIAYTLNQLNTYRGSSLPARLGEINDEYVTSNQSLVSGLYPAGDALASAMSSFPGELQSLFQSTLIDMANEDTPLAALDLPNALDLLITQMIDNAYTINRPTLGATAAAGSSNHGTGKLIASTTDADGLPLDYQLAEVVTFIATDSGFAGGGGTSGSESFSASSPPSVDALSEDWPAGSGTSATLTAFNAALTSGTIVTDGNFENWGGTGNNTPQSWTIAVGTAGTQIQRGTPAYVGDYAMKFIGDGSNLTAIRQDITDSMTGRGVYCFHLWCRTDGSVAAGVLNVRLVDGSGNVIADDASTSNSVTQAISAIGSTYTPVSGFFRMPSIVPEEVFLEVRLSTAMTNTEYLLIDMLGFQEATQLYDGGPWVGIFAGDTNFSINDSFTLTTTNSLGVTSFARTIDRMLDLRGLGFKIPSSGSPNINDNLIA